MSFTCVRNSTISRSAFLAYKRRDYGRPGSLGTVFLALLVPPAAIVDVSRKPVAEPQPE